MIKEQNQQDQDWGLLTLMLGSKRCMWCEVEEMVGGGCGGQRQPLAG